MTKRKIKFKEIALKWLRNVENIVFLICFIVFTIIGLCDNNLISMYKLFLFALLFGYLVRFIFYVKNKFF
jgi:hypothetical protein